MIFWRETRYPGIDIVIFSGTEKEKEVTVSTTELEDELLDETRNCSGQDAADLDDTIAYYIDPVEMKLPENEIIKIVEDALS